MNLTSTTIKVVMCQVVGYIFCSLKINEIRTCITRIACVQILFLPRLAKWQNEWELL